MVAEHAEQLRDSRSHEKTRQAPQAEDRVNCKSGIAKTIEKSTEMDFAEYKELRWWQNGTGRQQCDVGGSVGRAGEAIGARAQMILPSPLVPPFAPESATRFCISL